MLCIELHYFEKKQFEKETKDPLIKEIKKDGILL